MIRTKLRYSTTSAIGIVSQ